MGDRWLTIDGIGDGSSYDSGAVYTDINNQANSAASGGSPRVLVEVSDTGDFYVPMTAPGVNSSANQSPFGYSPRQPVPNLIR